MKRIRAHYVPQFYLKNFGGRIYQYDKQTGKASPSAPKIVAFQYDFYMDSSNDAALKLEGAMSQFEGDASAVISKIINAESVAVLSNDDKAKLCEFVAFQFARTPEYRYWRRDMDQSLRDKLRQMGIAVQHDGESEEHPGLAHLAAMIDYVNQAGPYFPRMRLYLHKNDTSIPFWTSDNPVVRHNVLTDKLGVGSPGVCYYLPLTPKLLLALYNGTEMDLLDDVARSRGIPEELWVSERDKVMEASMEKPNVIHANQLQARFSTRFVFSDRGHFHMMKAFRDADGDYKNRYTIQTGQIDGREHGDGSVITGDGWECRDGPVGGVEPLLHNLQNALWQYEAAGRETDTLRAFVLLYDSLEQATNLSWPGDQSGDEFDDKVRKLLDDPTLSIDRLRRLHDRIVRSERSGTHVDVPNIAECIRTLRQITARVILFKRDELEARASMR